MTDAHAHGAAATHQFSKSEVGFQHPAKGPDHCKDCVFFEVIKTHGCQIVSGLILPVDWCKKYVREKGKK